MKFVTIEQINRLPLDVLREVAKFHPLLIPPFTNDTLRRAVRDYVAGGERKRRIITKYGEISNWDTSRVTDMYGLFLANTYNPGARSFNQPLNNWDVSQVEDMQWMFYNARSFNQPLNNWNVSKVKDMTRMFKGATSFNQPLNNWDVSKVKDMHGMFSGATSFNQPLNKWNVSNVEDMSYMFDGATSFNKPLHAPWRFRRGRYELYV